MRPLFDLITLTAAASLGVSHGDHHLVIDLNTYTPPGTSRMSFGPLRQRGLGIRESGTIATTARLI